MSEIETPDDYGGIEPGTGVSFIVTASRSGKGFQAAAVTIADPPEEDKDNQTSIHTSFDDNKENENLIDACFDAMKVAEANDTDAFTSADTWGSGANAGWA